MIQEGMKNPNTNDESFFCFVARQRSQWDVNSVIKNCLCYDALCFFLRDFCLNH